VRSRKIVSPNVASSTAASPSEARGSPPLTFGALMHASRHDESDLTAPRRRLKLEPTKPLRCS
jgi:hypothetical protein